ncbi:hypothetical protein [Methylovulum sp.]|uniref:hypothetical protein n=1 Tax=Methylovulum sp. TaxID=1916980 RepID=UPI002609408B|nr:hypothetical protein [Methylovulum sp.]MDD5124774.1 hypothetical protein [Methylovulum sp.]
MKFKIALIFLLNIFNMVGCSKEKPADVNASSAPNDQATGAQNPQLEALNRAKLVEQVLQEGAEQEKRQIDSQTK